MKQLKICIIGGGASGIMAGLIARQYDAQVTILERNPRIGKKLLVTGNGRCNYTNILAGKDDYNHPDFVIPALDVFSPKQTVAFFEKLGIYPKIESEGKTFPLSEQASSFLDVALYELDRLGVEVITDSYVQSILKTKTGFNIYLKDDSKYEADKVIITTGGKAMPRSGSEGSGYVLAETLGHSVTSVFPALTKLKLESPYLKQLDGVKFSGTVELLLDDIAIQKESGDILFTKYGISGPAILQLSRKANELCLNGKQPFIKVIIINDLDVQAIRSRMDASLEKPIDFSLVGLINKRLISAILKEAGVIKQNAKLDSLTKAEIEKIIQFLFDWRFEVKGSMGFDDAQVTAGGVNVQEIDPHTMESKLIFGLYFAGEVVDIDAKCGGYNLQWAWSSGYLAGISAAKRG